VRPIYVTLLYSYHKVYLLFTFVVQSQLFSSIGVVTFFRRLMQVCVFLGFLGSLSVCETHIRNIVVFISQGSIFIYFCCTISILHFLVKYIL
jgi:hypothetical protein